MPSLASGIRSGEKIIVMRCWRRIASTAMIGLVALLFQHATHAAAKPKTKNDAAAPTGALRVLQVREDVYLIAGAGANIVVQIGSQGVIVVDTGAAAYANEVLATIKRLTDRPIRYILNTGPEADHVGGNEVLAKAGVAFGQNAAGPNAPTPHAPIVATLGVLQRMSVANYSDGAWPTQTLFNQKLKTLYLNGQGIEIFTKNGISDANAVVLFRGSDVLVTGGIFDVTRFPVIDLANGGSIQGEIDALNDLIDLAIPNAPLTWLDGGTTVVPARGRLCQQAELVEYRDMLTIIRDRVRHEIEQGKTLEQIKQAKPAGGYAPRYGSDQGSWTTDMFIEAVYRSLVQASNTASPDSK